VRLEERARRASDGIRRAVAAPASLERFNRYRERKRRTRQRGTVLLALVLTVAVVLLLATSFQHSHRNVPVGPSRSSGLILYGRWDPKGQLARWFTVRADGRGTRNLGVVATCANWFPDGSRILITNDAAVGSGKPLRPATTNPDGSGLRALDGTRDRNLNLGCGDVSPDGTRLALEGFNDAHPQLNGIYSVRASDGGGLVRLTRSPTGGSDNYPSYSPDGRLIAFFRAVEGVSGHGAGAIFVMNTDGTGLRKVTPWGFAFIGQSWSPDGRWIVFERPYGELYLVHPDGTGLHRIPLNLPAGSGATNPAWSPDGSWIAFSMQRNETANIYVVHPDGTGLRQVTLSRGLLEQSPDWGRLTG
jgi:hypothetical protein